MPWNMLKHSVLKFQQIRCCNYTFSMLENNLVFSVQSNDKHFQRHTDELCFDLIYELGRSQNVIFDSLL